MKGRVRRSRFFYCSLEESKFIDVRAFLKGQIKYSERTELVAFSVITASPHPISHPQLVLLSRLSTTEWTAVEEIVDAHDIDADAESIDDLVQKGLLLSDAVGGTEEELRQRDEALVSTAWSKVAAFFHWMSREPESKIDRFVDPESAQQRSEERVVRHSRRYGPPLDEFYSREDAIASSPLPDIEMKGGLYDVLMARRTTRSFDRSSKLSCEHLSILLKYVFGCHGRAHLGGELKVLAKTSPSGGSLHPIEVYPLVLRAEGFETGLYHYRVQDHSLEKLRTYELEIAENLAAICMKNQTYIKSAQVIFLMTARFNRNFWKYRELPRGYSVVLMDVGHLSQTFYLVSTDLGLRAFFSAAIIGERIEKEFGLDGATEGAIAMCGCGMAASEEKDPWRAKFEPLTSPPPNKDDQ